MSQERITIEASPRPNVKLREGATPITVDGEAHSGGEDNPISFPDLANQRAGWYHPRAADILRLYGDRYITVVQKGGR